MSGAFIGGPAITTLSGEKGEACCNWDVHLMKGVILILIGERHLQAPAAMGDSTARSSEENSSEPSGISFAE